MEKRRTAEGTDVPRLRYERWQARKGTKGGKERQTPRGQGKMGGQGGSVWDVPAQRGNNRAEEAAQEKYGTAW